VEAVAATDTARQPNRLNTLSGCQKLQCVEPATEEAVFMTAGFMAGFVVGFLVAAFRGEADGGEGVGATLTGGAWAILILILIGVTAAVITGAVTAVVFTQAVLGGTVIPQAATGGAVTGNSRIGRLPKNLCSPSKVSLEGHASGR
jgi:hypothetical protein